MRVADWHVLRQKHFQCDHRSKFVKFDDSNIQLLDDEKFHELDAIQILTYFLNYNSIFFKN